MTATTNNTNSSGVFPEFRKDFNQEYPVTPQEKLTGARTLRPGKLNLVHYSILPNTKVGRLTSLAIQEGKALSYSY